MRTIVATLLLLAGVCAFATPTTLVYIPSTDIQGAKTWHLDQDSYIFTNGDGSGSQAPNFTDVGALYGVNSAVEIGFDVISGAKNPVWLNAKIQLLSADKSPVAVALGAYNWNFTDNAMKQNMIYLLGSSMFSGTRFTYGYYTGDKTGLTNAVGADDKSGVLLGIDRTLSSKWWVGLDYQGGKNAIGALNPGVEYNFTDKIGVIVGYDYYNDHRIPGSYNIQLDANF